MKHMSIRYVCLVLWLTITAFAYGPNIPVGGDGGFRMWSNVLTAQTLTAVVTPGAPFRVAFDYPNDPAGVGFRIWNNDAIIANLATAQLTITKNAAGTWTIEAPVPGLPAGQHRLQVSAYAGDLPDAKSAPIPLTSTVAPVAPINLRIIVTVSK